MKSIITSVVLLLCCTMGRAQTIVRDSIQLSNITLLTQPLCSQDPIRGDKSHHPRTPALEPSVAIYNHTLLFLNGCDDSELYLYDSVGNEVYSYNINIGCDYLVLPEWLSGTYELHIHRGNYCFYGEIEL